MVRSKGGGLISETSSSHRYFAAVEPHALRENRLFRLFVTPDELVCIWAGSANDIGLAVSTQLGLLGFLVRAVDPSKKRQSRRLEELDSKPIDELRGDNKHNFVIRFDEVESAEITPSSFFGRTTILATYVGLLRLIVPGRKRLTFAITSNEDMTEAIDLLSARLGWKLQVGVAWDDERMKYGSVR